MNEEKKLVRMNDPLDLEPMNPVPVPGYEGFYYFPLDKRIAVHRVGAIIRVSDGKLQPHYQNSANRLFIVAHFDGKPKNYSVYRILAATFIGRPSRHLDKRLEDLQVNHIDGDQSNLSLDNLEWVTQKENAEHASLSGFILRSTPVIAKNFVTGEETKYKTISECCKVFNISLTRLWYSLKNNQSGKFRKGNHVFKYDDGSEWRIESFDKLQVIGERTTGFAVIVTDTRLLNTAKNKNIIFSSLKKSTEIHPYSVSRLRYQLSKQKVVRKGFFEFRYL